MKKLEVHNPFGSVIYHEENVTSTMDISRALAAESADEPGGAAHGTVITADFQEAGRGRIRDRRWEIDRGLNLLFTVLLRYPRIEDIPAALTLRAGLAVSLAIEDFAPSLKGAVKVKWPNDIIIDTKKITGILCEADGGNVHLGIGVNVFQKEFPAHLMDKATSIALAVNDKLEDRFSLLGKILLRLRDELENEANCESWQTRLSQRLYKKGEQVAFMEGAAADTASGVAVGAVIEGRLEGIGPGGELLIIPRGETQPRPFITGELKL